MKVHVDMNLCQSHGECAVVAPDVFQLGDDDLLRRGDRLSRRNNHEHRFRDGQLGAVPLCLGISLHD